ncbi:hypothetical protein AYJ54_01980 [Bradyrhizobium centrolobii]|uniref:Uncharacterized protein n=1 Tax=Bradyrhizobium centrolobii TaxID=1505087 RepID=A0A176YGC4_9BRAD|nr:hypothetical protein AYJ54_01980 [Bradyrhizobium centrolobii]
MKSEAVRLSRQNAGAIQQAWRVQPVISLQVFLGKEEFWGPAGDLNLRHCLHSYEQGDEVELN